MGKDNNWEWKGNFEVPGEHCPQVHAEENGRLHLVARRTVYMTTYGKKLKGFLEIIGRNLRGWKTHIFLDGSGAREYCHTSVIQIWVPPGWVGWTETKLVSLQWPPWLTTVLGWEGIKPKLTSLIIRVHFCYIQWGLWREVMPSVYFNIFQREETVGTFSFDIFIMRHLSWQVNKMNCSKLQVLCFWGTVINWFGL